MKSIEFALKDSNSDWSDHPQEISNLITDNAPVEDIAQILIHFTNSSNHSSTETEEEDKETDTSEENDDMQNETIVINDEYELSTEEENELQEYYFSYF